MVDDHYQIKQRTSQFFAAQMMTQEWAQPVDAEHKQFLVTSNVKDSEGHALVTAYALNRPDGQWSLMLINKDYDNPYSVRVLFHDSENNRVNAFAGPVTMITFGKAQYQWHPNRKRGYADPEGPPVATSVTATEDTWYKLPPASLTIVRGRLQAEVGH